MSRNRGTRPPDNSSDSCDTEETLRVETSDHIRLAARPVVARVTIVDTNVERMFTYRFALSPIRLGRHRASDLRLRHAQVARWHGEIGFAPDLVFFRNRAWTKPTWVDGRRLARGEAVTLSEHSVIAVGCFEIDVHLCRPAMRERERARKVAPLFWTPFSIVELARGDAGVGLGASADGGEAPGQIGDADRDARAQAHARGGVTRTFSPEAWRLLR